MVCAGAVCSKAGAVDKSQRSSRANPTVRKIGDQTRPYAAPLEQRCRETANLTQPIPWHRGRGRGRSMLPAREDRPRAHRAPWPRVVPLGL